LVVGVTQKQELSLCFTDATSILICSGLFASASRVASSQVSDLDEGCQLLLVPHFCQL